MLIDLVKNTLLVLSIALAACGGGSMESPDNHGFGWGFDAQGPKGLKLRMPNATAEDARFLEMIAGNVLACMGKSDMPPPPFVVVVPPGQVPPPPGFLLGSVAGIYMSNPPLIVLDADSAMIKFGDEVVHYGLNDTSLDHASPFYRECWRPNGFDGHAGVH